MKRRKYIIFSLIALLAVASVVFFVSVNTTVNAGNETVKTVQEYLDKNEKIDYSYVDLKDGVLTVSLNSKGVGYCTMEDVQATQYIYDAIHAAGTSGGVDDVQIYIYDTTGEKIYDSCEMDVSTPVEGKDELTDEAYEVSRSAQSDDIISTVESIVTKHCNAEISQIAVEPSVTSGCNCLTMVLSEESVEDVRVSNCDNLYFALEQYSFTTGEIKEFSITLKDNTGEDIIYMGGNFDFGDYSMWINQDVNEIVLDTGPVRTTGDSSDVYVENSDYEETIDSIYD